MPNDKIPEFKYIWSSPLTTEEEQRVKEQVLGAFTGGHFKGCSTCGEMTAHVAIDPINIQFTATINCSCPMSSPKFLTGTIGT